MMECKLQPQLLHTSDHYRQLMCLSKPLVDSKLCMDNKCKPITVEPFEPKYSDIMNSELQTRTLSPNDAVNTLPTAPTETKLVSQCSATRQPKKSNLFRLLTSAEQKANFGYKEERTSKDLESEQTSKSNVGGISQDVKGELGRPKTSAFRNLFAERLDTEGYNRRVPHESSTHFQQEEYRNLPNTGFPSHYAEALSAQVCRMSASGLSEREISTGLLIPESAVTDILKSLVDTEGVYRRPATEPYYSTYSQNGIRSGRRMTMPAIQRRRPHVDSPLDLRVGGPLYPPLSERPVLLVDGHELPLMRVENQRFVLLKSPDLTRLQTILRTEADDSCKCCGAVPVTSSIPSAPLYQPRVPTTSHSQHSESHPVNYHPGNIPSDRIAAPHNLPTSRSLRDDCDQSMHKLSFSDASRNSSDLSSQPLKKRRRMISPSNDSHRLDVTPTTDKSHPSSGSRT